MFFQFQFLFHLFTLTITTSVGDKVFQLNHQRGQQCVSKVNLFMNNPDLKGENQPTVPLKSFLQTLRREPVYKGVSSL